MKLPGKVIATIVVVAALAGAILWAQRSFSRPASIHLSAKDMELLISTHSPDQLRQFRSDPSQKQSFVDDVKKALALGTAAEAAGYGERPAIEWQIGFQSDLLVFTSYQRRNPGARATDDEIARFYQANPQAFEDFIQYYPDPKTRQIAGAQKEQLKRQVGEFKVLAARGRSEGLGKDKAMQLQDLVNKYGTMAAAYHSDLRNDDKLVSDVDIAAYHKSHSDDFREVRARHILVSTNATPTETDDEDKADGKPKALSKDEARKKAEAILQRIQKGEDFATLARENSDDPGSKTQGGDVGYFGRGRMAPEFEQAAFSLKPGQLSGIVETKYGFHIIKLEDIRQLDASDSKVRQQITDKLKDEAINKRIDQIVRDSNVTVAENFEVPEPPGGGDPRQGQLPPGHP